MKYRTGLIGLMTGVLIAGAASWAADEVTVKVWPDKVLYDVKQNAKFDVTLTNTRKEPVKGTLVVSLFWEMEDTRKLLEQSVDLAAGETKTVTTEWPTREVLGCEVRADFKDGQKILVTGSEYFNVCRSKDSQRVGIHVEYPDLFTFPEKAYLDSIPAKVLSLRMAYGNIVEHFGWCPDIYCELAPQRDEWCSSYWQSKAAIQKAVEEEHKQGMKSLHYAAGYLWALPGAEMMRRHPDWIFYRESGQPWGGGIINVRKLDYERNPDRAAMHKLAGGGLQGVFPDFSRKEAVEFGVQQLIESKKMFGWDGVRFDGHYIMWTSICPGARDISGKMLVAGKEAEAVTRRNTDYTRKTVSKVFPDYLFMFNASSHDPDIVEIARDGGAPANEPIRESFSTTSQWNSWKAFAQYMLDDGDNARKNGGYAYAYMNPPWCVSPNVDRIQYAILFAANNHPWFSFPALDRPSDTGGTHFPIQKDLFRFATRYSAALWGQGIERVKSPETMLDVASSQGNVWWKEFVYQRPLADGKRQLVVHLINEPPSQNIMATTQELPVPVKAIVVKFKIPVTKAWIIGAEPAIVARSCAVDQGSVTVPELKVWQMVVAEMPAK